MADERRTPLCESGGETTTREGMQGSVFRELMEIEPSNEQVEVRSYTPCVAENADVMMMMMIG